MTYTATAARIHRYGPPDVLKFESVTVGDPGRGQVRVRNHALGLNFVDVYYRRGTFPVPCFPYVLGNEAAGTVDAIGDGVTEWKVGDRVAYCDDINGSYATARLYDASRLVAIPDDVSDEQACAVLLKGLTARYLLKEVTSLETGDTVLYHAAAGGVGRIFTRWGTALGLEVIGTVSSAAKADAAYDGGCVHVINYRDEDFVQGVLDFTAGRGVRAVFDSVGRDTFLGSLKALAVRGMLVVFGKASGELPEINPFVLAPRALQMCWPILPQYVSTRDELVRAAADLFAAVRLGHVDATPDRTYSFDDLIEAHDDLEQRRTTGSIVLKIT